MSNSVTQQVHWWVFDALAKPQTGGHQPMQVFVNISSKVYFILKNYVRQPSQVDYNFVEFLSCRVRSSFPEQGVTSHIFILCRGALLYP